jgi:oxygen-independent coproporphyrinogen-3 oxidase
MYEVRYKSHHDASRALKKHFEECIDKKAYVAELLNSSATTRRVIYLHVPFCNKVCSFCPFHRPDELKRREYDDYLIAEIEKLSKFKYMQAPIDAVNFGGGTPTSLQPKQMARVLGKLREAFDIKENAEISVETSITELTDEMTDVLKEYGVNRLSVGIQTFDDGGRKLLGRRGNGEKAIERLIETKNAGFENIGVDLIYNYPDETMQMLERDLEIIKSLSLAGVSFYSLMLHEKTPIYGKITPEQLANMQDIEREKEFFDLILDTLSADGYKPFELTKLIRNNLDRYEYMRVRHSGGSCIAIGHGAGGNLDRYVYHNSVHSPLLDEQIPVSSMGRILSLPYFILDEFINDLQKMSVNLDVYSKRLDFALAPLLSESLERLEKEGLLTIDGAEISLSRDGIFWGNNIIDEFIRSIIGYVNGKDAK